MLPNHFFYSQQTCDLPPPLSQPTILLNVLLPCVARILIILASDLISFPSGHLTIQPMPPILEIFMATFHFNTSISIFVVVDRVSSCINYSPNPYNLMTGFFLIHITD